MEVIVNQHFSKTHCTGFDKVGRSYVIEMPKGFYYLKGKKLIGDKKFIGDTRCLVNVKPVDDKFVKAHLPVESEYVYG
jgi:hypothetical protein